MPLPVATGLADGVEPACTLRSDHPVRRPFSRRGIGSARHCCRLASNASRSNFAT